MIGLGTVGTCAFKLTGSEAVADHEGTGGRCSVESDFEDARVGLGRADFLRDHHAGEVFVPSLRLALVNFSKGHFGNLITQ